MSSRRKIGILVVCFTVLLGLYSLESVWQSEAVISTESLEPARVIPSPSEMLPLPDRSTAERTRVPGIQPETPEVSTPIAEQPPADLPRMVVTVNRRSTRMDGNVIRQSWLSHEASESLKELSYKINDIEYRAQPDLPSAMVETLAPAAGLTIEVVPKGTPPGSASRRMALTNRFGTASFADMPPGPCKVLLWGTQTDAKNNEELCLDRRVVHVLKSDFEISIEIATSSCSASGQVLNSAGHAIHGARIVAKLNSEDVGWNSDLVFIEKLAPVVRTVSDPRGAYTLKNLVPLDSQAASKYVRLGAYQAEMYDLFVEAEGYAPMQMLIAPIGFDQFASARDWLAEARALATEFKPSLSKQEHAEGIDTPTYVGGAQILPDITLFRAAKVAGTLYDNGGSTLGDMPVRLMPMTHKPMQPGVATPIGISTPLELPWMRTTEEGHFSMPPIPPGTYRFQALIGTQLLEPISDFPLKVSEGQSRLDMHVIIPTQEAAGLLQEPRTRLR